MSATGVAIMLFPVRLVGLLWLENRFGAYHHRVRDVIVRDLVTILFFALVTFPIAQYVSNKIGVRAPVAREAIDSLPVVARVLLYVVVADFGHYWLHRLMHQPLLWPIHRWHHSPSHMSWSAGARETIPDAILVNLAYVFAWPLLGTTTHRLEIFLLVFVMLKNDWMHLNVRWRLPWLEWLIVTPRYHHIHHSVDAAHHNCNIGILLTIWDRLFGTYVDPEKVGGPLKFGTGEPVSAPRLIAGL